MTVSVCVCASTHLIMEVRGNALPCLSAQLTAKNKTREIYVQPVLRVRERVEARGDKGKALKQVILEQPCQGRIGQPGTFLMIIKG